MMVDLLVSLVMRLIGLRIARQLVEESRDLLDRTEPANGSPGREAVMRGQREVLTCLLGGGALPPATAATPQLVSPQAPAPEAGQGVVVPLPQPAPVVQAPVPAALP